MDLLRVGLPAVSATTSVAPALSGVALVLSPVSSSVSSPVSSSVSSPVSTTIIPIVLVIFSARLAEDLLLVLCIQVSTLATRLRVAGSVSLNDGVKVALVFRPTGPKATAAATTAAAAANDTATGATEVGARRAPKPSGKAVARKPDTAAEAIGSDGGWLRLAQHHLGANAAVDFFMPDRCHERW
jgi:hypothetical protein